MGNALDSGSAKRAVFLDRDGVLNQAIMRGGKPYPPAALEQVVLVPDARSSLEVLKGLGFLLVVVTNQPDVRRGIGSQNVVEAIHGFLSSRLPLDDIFACFHDDGDHCSCRKPLPGMLFEAALKHGINLGRSYLVGDRWRDIEAGVAAGCRTVLIDYDYKEQRPRSGPDVTVLSLAEAVTWIIRQEQVNN